MERHKIGTKLCVILFLLFIFLMAAQGQSQNALTNQQKQQEILDIVNSHRGTLPSELVLAIIRLEGGEGAFHVDGWDYNSFYGKSDAPWAQPTNGDGIMQVTAASGYHKTFTNDQAGYNLAISSGCSYLSELHNTYGTYAQTVLHYNTGPNSLYIYLGKNQGDRDYLSHVSGYLSDFIHNTYGFQNQNLAESLNQGQKILNDYLYNKGIATGQSMDWYRPYQKQLDNDLHKIESKEDVSTPAAVVSGSINTGTQNAYAPSATVAQNAHSTNPPRITWRRSFGGGAWDVAHSVQQTSDGGYILAGTNCGDGGTGGNCDAWLIKTDADGNEIWDKNFGGPEQSEKQDTPDAAFSVQQTSDGGYIIVGNTWTINGNDDAWIFKTDSNGNQLWSKAVEGPGDESASSFLQTNDGGYIIVGTTYHAKNSDLWLAKTDSNGNKLWDKTFGGSGREGEYNINNWPIVPTIQQTNDGGYIISSYTESFDTKHGWNGAWLVKTDAEGNELWNKTSLDSQVGCSVQQTSDGGYIIVGINHTKQGHDDCACLVKTDSLGNKEWLKTFDDSDAAFLVRQTSDGGYILVGHNTSYATPVWMAKTDASGNQEWDKIFGGGNWDVAHSIQLTSDGGYILAGGVPVWLAKIGGNKDVSMANIPRPKTDTQSKEVITEKNSAKAAAAAPATQPDLKENIVTNKASGFCGILAIAALLCIFILRRMH